MTESESKKVKVGDRLWHNMYKMYVIVVEKDNSTLTYNEENNKNKGGLESWKYVDFEPIFIWNDNKVIEFVNWYINLKELPFNYTLENKNIIDSFKKGDDYKIWHIKK